MSIGTGLGKLATSVGQTASKAASTTAGKIALTGAAVGGGTYLAATGVSSGIERITESTGLNNIGSAITGDQATGKGAGNLIGLGILVALVLLAVFLILPKLKKQRGK